MKKHKIQLSSEFKVHAIKAIAAIAFFAITYFILLVLAIILTALCIVGGFSIIASKPMFLSIVFGVGLASLGVLILIFLLKFVFASNKVDRSHLIEINMRDEPALFNMIHEIVEAVGTTHPKKVYLSTEVNACVFYDSHFWSMFLPIKKNLLIGLGLVNTVTKEELKAILCHEFGHFSQKTMKVGSYVYNVNQIIFNMLYDNESYVNLIERWANVSGYFSIFITIAVKINEGIQWILGKLYEVVNKSYMGLSREMEFHADEIAASITGYEPLKNSLLRMSLADYSFNNVLNFYGGKVSDNIKSENIFGDQTSVIKFLAEINNLPIKNELPDISFEAQSKFDKSKLVIKDQWASHPTIEERIKRLERTGFSTQNNTDALANTIFKDIQETQKQLTNKLFESVSYQGETKFVSADKFQKEYKEEVLSNSFDKVYNGYYDNKHPTPIELNQSKPLESNINVAELFSDEKVDLAYTVLALQNDIETLKNISTGSLSIKTFDYDGMRYKRKDTDSLIEKLKIELEKLNELINKNDANIYAYFNKVENEQNKSKNLAQLYSEFFAFDKSFDSKFDIYIKLVNELEFVGTTTPFEQIRINLNRIKLIEENLKIEISQLMSNNLYTTEISDEIQQNLRQYTSATWEYFNGTNYNEQNLDILYKALTNYAYLLSRGYFLMKKKILSYQAELIKSHL